MTWIQIRAHYERLFREAKTRGQTQTTIAHRGGLKQNLISRLLANKTDKGPSVDTLVRAVKGLDMSMSAFFLGLETDDVQPLLDRLGTRPPDATDQRREVTRLLRHALRLLARRPRP